MKTMLIFIAIVLAGILAKPLFEAIVSLPFPTSGKYGPQGGGDGYGIAIIGFIVTVLLLIVFLTALIVAACKISNGRVLTGVWAAIILLFAIYPTIHFIKEYPDNQFEKNQSKLNKMLADGAPDEKIKPLAEKVAKKYRGHVFDELVKYFKFDMAREMIENGYDISKSSYLLSDMVEEGRLHTDPEFTRAVFRIENGADVNAKAHRGTPIFHAIIWGSLKSVKLLLDNGADIDIRNQEGETPLSCAKRLGENGIVALLLKYGVTEDNK